MLGGYHIEPPHGEDHTRLPLLWMVAYYQECSHTSMTEKETKRSILSGHLVGPGAGNHSEKLADTLVEAQDYTHMCQMALPPLLIRGFCLLEPLLNAIVRNHTRASPGERTYMIDVTYYRL